MCYITISLKNKKKADVVHVATKLDQKQKTNDDGTSVMVFSSRACTVEKKNMRGFDLGEYADMLDSGRLGIVHQRMTTAGVDDLDNLHLWKRRGWVFAHNGTIYGEEYTGRDKSDSRIFFEKIIKKNLVKKGKPLTDTQVWEIDNLADVAGLHGRFLLYNPELDILYLYGSWHVQEVDGVLSITSAEVTHYQRADVSMSFGDVVFSEKKTVHGVKKTKINGIFMLKNASTWGKFPKFVRLGRANYNSYY